MGENVGMSGDNSIIAGHMTSDQPDTSKTVH